VLGYAEAVQLLNDPRLHASMAASLESIGVTTGPLRDVAAASLLSLNGAEHRRQRALVAHRFTPRAVERARPVARAAAERLVSNFETAGRCEFVADFATPYVRTSTCDLVGYPEQDVADRWHTLEFLETAMRNQRVLDESDLESLGELITFAATALDQRRREPGDDVLTTIAAELAEGSLTEPAAIGLAVALLSAGHQPTIKQLGITMVVLADHPDLWEALGTGELEPPGVIEAILRLRSTNQAAIRRVAQPFEYQGVCFEAGDAILVNLAAANRDPRRFDDPEVLDLDPTGTPHVSFGFGPHHCLGASLARAQLQEALRILSERLTALAVRELVEDTVPGLAGPTSLGLSFASRSARLRS
jgi:cytochrome P450